MCCKIGGISFPFPRTGRTGQTGWLLSCTFPDNEKWDPKSSYAFPKGRKIVIEIFNRFDGELISPGDLAKITCRHAKPKTTVRDSY
jgi:hypothetical protein